MQKPPTPLVQQYLEIKAKYKDAILFYRLGDFYEMFFEDAVTAAPVLDLTLTSRHKDVEDPVPMCGVPYHAAAPYIKKLQDAGFKVAICEQLEDPSKAKGIVKRDVIRVATPGLVYDPDTLEPRQTNYISALAYINIAYGIAFFEPSTSELLLLSTADPEQAFSEVKKLMPREMVYKDRSLPDRVIELFGGELPFILTPLPEQYFDWDPVRERVTSLWGGQLAASGADGSPALLSVVSALFRYLEDTKTPISNVTIKNVLPSSYLYMDNATIRNLELFSSIIDGSEGISLIGTMDRTVTPMGSRMLRSYLRFPSVSADEIAKRHAVVDHLFNDPVTRSELRDRLGDVGDMERSVTKAHSRTLVPQSLQRLSASIEAVRDIKSMIHKDVPLLSEFYGAMDDLSDIGTHVRNTLDLTDDQAEHGWFVRNGINAQLDELKALVKDTKGWLKHFEQDERSRTGINSLKVGYSGVFGYYIDVTRPNLRLVPDDYIRKQTVANGERFITPKLKEMEVRLLSARGEIKRIESGYLVSLNEVISGNASRILKTASIIAAVDVLACFSEIAVRNNYVRPVIDYGDAMDFKEARHPVIERHLKNAAFIPNDIDMNCTDRQVIIITGPNMSGKSTIIRQSALIVLMAQMGSFVPAREARIGIVDRIFARVGASDHLARGQSTFMVEMTETANILGNATGRSLIILDEIGRGTSTYDGISIAWAVLDHIANRIGAKTLFATHYHELIEFGRSHPKAVNQSIPVKQWQGRLIFVRKLVDGGSNESFGIEVAKMAGLPAEVIGLAQRLLKKLQDGEIDSLGRPRLAEGTESHAVQYTLFRPDRTKLHDMLAAVSPDAMTPLEALQFLVRLKEAMGEEKSQGKAQ
ncbi:MAG: DNA mismatch repair protein MutS [Deltaproteobacteria bacterium]|nr:DNA mismatch repair protein MutS [Deltaproteobacteria bacterium]